MKHLLLFTVLLMCGTNLNAQYITSVEGESYVGACDGSVMYQFQTPVFGVTMAIIDNLGMGFYDTLSVPEGDTIGQVVFTNLCAGSWALYPADSFGIHFDTLYFNISSSDSLIITTASTNETLAGSCDGTGIVYAFGGSGPITYTLIDQDSTFVGSGSNYSYLCPGLYIAQAIDSAGNTASQSFLVVNASSVYGPPNIQDSVFIDTLSASAIQACNINYANVTNVFMNAYYLTMNSDSMVIEWLIETPDAMPDMGYIIYQVYYFDTTITTGNIYTTLDLYCPVTKSLAGALKGQGVLNLGQLSAMEHFKSGDNVVLFPNPSNNEINIVTDFNQFDYSVYTANGQLVFSKKNVSTIGTHRVDIRNLEKGMYIIQIRNKDYYVTKRFVKE